MSKKLQISSGDSGGYSPPAYCKEMQLAAIDVKSEASLEKWQQVLALSRAELLEAIKNFGPVVRDIRRGLLYQNRDDNAA